jgi:hypothetical protein
MNVQAHPIISTVPESSELTLPVVVIGAGPVGLAAAAHLARRGMPFLLLERGQGPAAAMRQWAHVTIFSPWRFNIDETARGLLEATGWRLAPEFLDRDPTAREMIAQYLEPLAAHPLIAPNVRYNSRIEAIAREDMDLLPNDDRFERPFEVVVQDRAGEQRIHARAVIDASGTWCAPNPAGTNGIPAEGERDCAERIVYGIPDAVGGERSRYAGRRVLVIGGGHSAMDALLELAKLKREVPSTTLFWAMRNKPTDKTFGGGSEDQLASRGALGTRAHALLTQGIVELVAPFRTKRFALKDNGLVVTGSDERTLRHIEVDEAIVATGFRPDFSMLSELRLDLDPVVQAPRALAPLIDPNFHSCGDVPPHGHRELRQPEANFYIAGMKSYGRAPTFLMATGYEQVRSIVAAIAGDVAAADEVRLVLPTTGVCEGLGHDPDPLCCGGPAASEAASCCRADEVAKDRGEPGCGCSDRAPPSACC